MRHRCCVSRLAKVTGRSRSDGDLVGGDASRLGTSAQGTRTVSNVGFIGCNGLLHSYIYYILHDDTSPKDEVQFVVVLISLDTNDKDKQLSS